MKFLLLFVSVFIISFSSFSQHHKCSRAGHSVMLTTHPQADTLDILNYQINLNITDFTNKTISGNTVVKLTPKINNLTVITLDLLKLIVDSIKINDIITTYSYNDTLLKINTTLLNSTDTVDVTVYYNGEPITDPSGWGGFYFSGNTAFNLGVGFADTPHNYGRIWFPCVDDFVDRAYYSFNITTPDDLMAVCNGTLQNETDNGDGTKTFAWVLRDNIPTYLASVAVSDYTAVEDIFNGINGAIPTQIYVAPSQVANAQASFINLNPTLNAFEQSFGAYMWERVGYVSVPFNSGAMEHATNIAYPAAAINGSLNNETLMAHELSHHWFGDLVTCRTPEDMWLNEGWASYCESIFTENIYGKQAFTDYVRANHFDVLKNAHTNDGGYYAVSGIPQTITYGSTVYNKGADMAHTLRSYLGDDKFFSGVQNYLTHYSFSDASSEDFRDNLTAFTGIDMNDFFDSWIFTAGFSQFDLDSFNVVPNGGNFDVTVYLQQKLYHKTTYANSNRIPISFMKQDWSYIDTTLVFSGETGSQTYTLDFNPYSVWVDRQAGIMGASVKKEEVITATGIYSSSETDLYLRVMSMTDSAKMRITHNWVAPDGFIEPINNFNISTSHYWKVDGYFPNDYVCRTKFYYSSNSLDEGFITNDEDSLVLLYKPDEKHDWQIINDYVIGSMNSGYIQIDTLKIGIYCFGLRDTPLSIGSINSDDELIKVFPNPVKDILEIKSKDNNILEYSIIDVKGKSIILNLVENNTKNLKINTDSLKTGVYFIKIKTTNRITSHKFIKE